MDILRQIVTYREAGAASAGPPCRVCDGPTAVVFSLPRTKRTGAPIPDLPDDCPHFECADCGFVFNDMIAGDGRELYSPTYWQEHAASTPIFAMRLLMLASAVLERPIESADILDFGCGQGRFVEEARRELGLRVWGTDINPPPFGTEHFLADVGDRRFDVVIATEVVEHLPRPRATLEFIFDHLAPGGVFAFQTACWNARRLGRDWWYLGPANGHVSFHTRASLDWLAQHLSVARRVMWNSYPGIQAWAKGEAAPIRTRMRSAAAAELAIRNGARHDGNLIVDSGAGARGTIVFGPYWALEPGRYRVTVIGDIEGTYGLRLTTGQGATELAKARIGARSPSVDFAVSGRCEEFECVIQRRRGSRGLRLECVVLHRLGAV